MEPHRKISIQGHKIEEFCWGNKYVVYIDNKLVPENFELYEKFTREEIEQFLEDHQKEQLKKQVGFKLLII